MTEQELLTADIRKINWKGMTPEQIDDLLEKRIVAYECHIQNDCGGKRPKRESYIVERIAQFSNLKDADKEAQAGKVKINRYIRRHNERADEELRELQLMILTLEFPEPEYEDQMVTSDAGKRRMISKQKYYPWRILHHAVIRVIWPIIERRLTAEAFACIKGRGLHYGVKRMKRQLRRYPEYEWFWKTDYKKFYQSIPHEVIIWALQRTFKDKAFIRLIEVAILTYDTDESIIQDIHEEQLRKERSAYWSIHEPAIRQPSRQRHRPLRQRTDAGQMLPALLRRYDGKSEDEMESKERPPRIQQNLRSHRSVRKERCHCSPDWNRDEE